jgi:hypothetical protein
MAKWEGGWEAEGMREGCNARQSEIFVTELGNCKKLTKLLVDGGKAKIHLSTALGPEQP